MSCTADILAKEYVYMPAVGELFLYSTGATYEHVNRSDVKPIGYDNARRSGI